jgi:hypothetical protein
MVYYSVSSYNSDMFLVGILSWWYGHGWLGRVKMIGDRLKITADFYSVGLLVSTLFAPYRQISTNAAVGSIRDHIKAFFDKLLSRIIGSIVRTSVVIFGSVVMSSQIVFGTTVLILWLAAPLLPVAGLIAWTIGWVPL